METVNLTAGDELVLGPVTIATRVKYEIKASVSEADFAVRDALEHRDQQIERLRARVAELEAKRGATADEIVDAAIERFRRAFL